MRMVSKGESIEGKIEGNIAAAKQAESAVCAVVDEFATAAIIAEKGIESLLGTAEGLPLLGGVFRLLKKCWQAAKEIKKTERAVEKLMRTAAGLVDHFEKAKRTLSKDDVTPLEKQLTAVAEFLDERRKRGTIMNALTHEEADEKIDGLNEDLQVAMQAIGCNIGLAVYCQVQQLDNKVDKLLELASGQPVVGKSSDADSVYAYIAVQRPPVVTGQAISLNSINVCLQDMREGFETVDEAKKWTDHGCFPVSLNDGSRASIVTGCFSLLRGLLAPPQQRVCSAPCFAPY
jgi:hypothetical protein